MQLYRLLTNILIFITEWSEEEGSCTINAFFGNKLFHGIRTVLGGNPVPVPQISNYSWTELGHLKQEAITM
jgi:hypothetical protein